MPIQNGQLFSPINILGVGVATLAVNVVTNTFYRLLKFPPKWTAFIAALIVAYLVVGMQGTANWYDWVLAFFNACLIFCSALGINEVGAAAIDQPGKGFAAPRPILRSWIKP
jgi:uncharacterized membrane protein YjjP (DUF1212 family)